MGRETLQDARHTLRLWSRSPWQTGFAILALAIGIGANTGVFSVVNALLLQALPFREPERLAALSNFIAPHDSVAQFHEWRGRSSYLADTALFEPFDANLGGAGEWRRAHVVQTSSNFFTLLGTQPILGRGFAAGDDVNGTGWGKSGRNAVAVIGYGLWQALFGGDPKALGATIRLDGNPFTVIGIAPPGFDFPGHTVLWKPAAFSPGNNGWEVVARLKSGITWAQARAEFAAEADRLWPNRTQLQKIQSPSRIVPLRDELAGPRKNASVVLMICVALILLIACTNVANLLMARTADRTTELSIRSALGASRRRLSRQLLTECMLLSLVAAAAGLLVALWATSVASKFEPTPLATQTYSLLNARVLAFAIAASIVTGLLFGVLPSLYAGRVHTFGTRTSTNDRGARRIRETFVAGQVALTVVLLVGSATVGRALADLMQIDRGFEGRGLVTVNVSLEGTTHRTAVSRLAYSQEALDRIRRLPEVRSASATEFLPMYATAFIGGPFQMDGVPAKESSTVIPILPDYFRTMGGRVLWGREFTAAETRADARIAMVNERFASQFGPPAHAVGHQISIGSNPPRKIVGVVRGMDYMREGKTTGETFNQIFVPSHSPGGFFSAFVARVKGSDGDRLAHIRDTIQSVDPQVPVFGVKTMEQRMADLLARPRFYRTAVFCFASFAVLLAAIGIYGIVSYAVAQRTREMGVRMALGTTPSKLRTRVLAQMLALIAVGTIPGIAGTAIAGRLIQNLVDGAKAVSGSAYAGSVLFILAVAAASIWAATHRIAHLNIVDILRTE